MRDEQRSLAQAFDKLLLQLLPSLLEHVASQTRKVALTVPQLYLLRQLNAVGPWTAGQVGEALGITSGPVSGLTKRLIARGLVERRMDEHDRRVAWFSCTEAGKAVLDEAENLLVSLWGRVIGEIGLQPAAELLELVVRVATILRGLEPAAGGPDA